MADRADPPEASQSVAAPDIRAANELNFAGIVERVVPLVAELLADGADHCREMIEQRRLVPFRAVDRDVVLGHDVPGRPIRQRRSAEPTRVTQLPQELVRPRLRHAQSMCQRAER